MKMRSVVPVVAGLLVGLGVYFAAHAGGAPSPVERLSDWLDLSAAQRDAVREADPSFETESATLTARLRDDRAQLAKLLVASDSADEAIRTQLERVIDTEVTLERRVSEFVLTIRGELTAEQRARLMGYIADGLRTKAGDHLAGDP